MTDVTRVKIEGGLIQGKYSEDGQVRIFKGVPYAAPPVGALRWRNPQPVTPWEGVRETRYYNNANMHVRPSVKTFYGKEFDQVEYPISEDCLYLNIWAPVPQEGEVYPVALWFHGGDSHANKLIFDGENFARAGVIVMTVGFRTGPFAGFCHPELSAEAEREIGHHTSGNYGLLDQVAAVKWVKRNIEALQGDPNRITVFGQSAGGTVVQRLISTPLLEGDLFAAIMQSAGGMDPRYMTTEVTLEEGEAYGVTLLEKNGIPSLEAARELSALEILKLFAGPPELTMANFSPKPDGYSLLQTPDRTGWLAQHHKGVHVMIGTTKHEGFAYTYRDVTQETLKAYLEHSYGEYWQEYWGAARVSTEAAAVTDRLNDSRDLKMATCYSWVQRQNELAGMAPYVYMFTKEAPGPECVGAFHSGEHAYVFQNMDRVPWRPYTDGDRELSQVMSGYWANFMKTGDPNGAGLPWWEPSADMKDDPWIMELGRRVGMVRPPETKVSRFIRAFCLNFYDRKG
ncbi:MAG: carboxylesterase family protein [Lachnospiraceae bacterium]|nr:carboxylesterase family protein [Lachnospiraceae bacterium]